MLIYLAHPIDQTTQAASVQNVVDLLDSLDYSHYRPGGAFALAMAHAELRDLEIVDRINTFALRAADAVVAWLPSGVISLGVPAEIEAALQQDKPVVVLTTGGLSTRSVQLTNWRLRGAFVVEFDHKRMISWEKDPTDFALMLTMRPSQLGLMDEPESVSRETHAAANPYPELPVATMSGATFPTRGHPDDAGIDLAIYDDEVLQPGEYRLLSTGIRAAVPHGYWGMITGRSSTWAKHRCDVRLAVIDAGYRGELMIGIENRSDRRILFPAGTRLAQYVLLPAWLGEAVNVGGPSALPAHERGENGYGSTGA